MTTYYLANGEECTIEQKTKEQQCIFTILLSAFKKICASKDFSDVEQDVLIDSVDKYLSEVQSTLKKIKKGGA